MTPSELGLQGPIDQPYNWATWRACEIAAMARKGDREPLRDPIYRPSGTE